MKKIGNRGLTLTELAIVVAVIGVISVIGAQIMIQFNRYLSISKVRIDLQRDARAIFTIINRNLRQAQKSTVVIDRVSGQPPYSRIAFTKIGGQTFMFYQRDKNLIMTTAGGDKILSGDLRYMAFTPPKSEDLAIISVSLTLEKEIFETRSKALHMASEKVMVMNP